MPREESFRLIEDQKIKAEINGEEREFFEIRSYLDNGGYGQVSLYLNKTHSRRLFENESTQTKVPVSSAQGPLLLNTQNLSVPHVCSTKIRQIHTSVQPNPLVPHKLVSSTRICHILRKESSLL